MSKKRAKATKQRAPMLIVVTWVSSFLSLGLLFLTGSVLMSDFGSFRSCSHNNGLTVSSCGKQSLNLGDLMLCILFVLSAALVVSLFTAAWRMSKRTHR